MRESLVIIGLFQRIFEILEARNSCNVINFTFVQICIHMYTHSSLSCIDIFSTSIPRIELSLQSDEIFWNIARTYEWGIGRTIAMNRGSFFHIPVMSTDVRYHKLELTSQQQDCRTFINIEL